MAQQVDYISPMLYPSGFQYGIPGYPNPVLHPHQIVYRSLRKAEERTGLPAVRFRPWLQAFRDYAFGGKPFGGEEIAAQIDAAQTFGSDGWMLWNPRNVYTTAGLPPKSGLAPPTGCQSAGPQGFVMGGGSMLINGANSCKACQYTRRLKAMISFTGIQ